MPLYKRKVTLNYIFDACGCTGEKMKKRLANSPRFLGNSPHPPKKNLVIFLNSADKILITYRISGEQIN